MNNNSGGGDVVHLDKELFKRWWSLCFVLAADLIPEVGLEVCIAHSAMPAGASIGDIDVYWRAEVRTFDNKNPKSKVNDMPFIADADTEYEACIRLLTKLLQETQDRGMPLPPLVKAALESGAEAMNLKLSDVTPKKVSEPVSTIPVKHKVPSNLN